VASGKILYDLFDPGNIIQCAAYSPDGTRIATGTWKKNVKLWDTATGKDVFSLALSGAAKLSFSPDGRQLTAFHYDPKKSHVRIWDTSPPE
jgi:WD40 repeat protein